jgi:inner membrane protein
LCSVLPDVDAIGRPFGLGDLSFLGGHRALTHSLPFAFLLGVAVAWLVVRQWPEQGSFRRVAIYLVLATASHGVLDAFASYGDGVAFFFPFSTARYAAPWRPIRALNEVWWIWLPATIVIIAFRMVRRRSKSRTERAAA